MRLGFIGLGNMGGAIARRLRRLHELHVFDLDQAAMQTLVREGAIPAADPASLGAQCDCVFTCLPTSNHVHKAIFGDNGLSSSLQAGSTIVDMTTGDPLATRTMASELRSKSIELIDAPVSGGARGAAAGTLSIMVGAPESIYAKISPILQGISPNVTHCGDTGAGHVMKLVNNVIAAGVRTITFEALAMGIKNGLSFKTCAEVLDKGSARSYTTEKTLPAMLLGQSTSHFSLGLMHKDIRLATQLAADSGAPMLVGGVIREIFQAAVNELGPDEDFNALVRLFERQASVVVAV
jgi:3-hydroxyisobutyrate dehydrogenase